MTIGQFAVYRYAKQNMTPEEGAQAAMLAAQADAGDQAAYRAFRALIRNVIHKKAHERPVENK